MLLSMLSSLQNQFDASAQKVASSLPPSTTFEKFHVLTLDYRTPIVASILYVLVVSFFSRLNREKAAKAKSSGFTSDGKRTSSRNKKEVVVEVESRFTPFKCLVIAHNVFLCLYSATAFLSVLPILLRPYFNYPLLEAVKTLFCDVEKKTFAAGVHFWVWNFYVSKYYELLDTAILLLKGKPSSFLQTFHHSGSIIGMWIMTTTHAPAAWIFVLFNSFIHTIMYFYYTLTCLGYRPTWKRILTTMQITQFLVGNPLGLIYAVLPGCLPLEKIPPENVIGKLLGSQLRSLYACLFVNTFFISSLVVLFTDFSRKTYGKPSDKKPAEDKQSVVQAAEKTFAKAAEKTAVKAVAVKSIKAVKEKKPVASASKASIKEPVSSTSKASSKKSVATKVEPTSPKKANKSTKKEVEASVLTRRSPRKNKN